MCFEGRLPRAGAMGLLAENTYLLFVSTCNLQNCQIQKAIRKRIGAKGNFKMRVIYHFFERLEKQ